MNVQWTIRSFETGKVVPVYGSVAVKHPDWVHAQLGTKNEIELQLVLDQLSADDFLRHGECLETGLNVTTEEE